MSGNLPGSFPKVLSRPVELVAWVLIGSGILITPFLNIPADNRRAVYVLLLFSATYVTLFFRGLLPFYHRRPWLYHLNAILAVGIAAAFQYLTGLRAEAVTVYMLLVAVAGILLGGRFATLMAALAALATLVIFTLHAGLDTMRVLAVFFQFCVLTLSGCLAARMAETIRAQARETQARNRNLALLLDMSPIGNSLDLESCMPILAEKVVRGLSCTFCSIYLLDRDRKELINYGFYPVRRPAGGEIKLGQRYALDTLYWHARALTSRQPLVLRQDVPVFAIGEEEMQALMFENLQTACLAPLWFEKQPLGVLSVGEVREWEREPFSAAKLELLSAIAAQISIVINNAHLHQATRRQVEHMAVINEVTRAIASAIEMNDLLDLIYEQLNRVISTDTYYVGLLDESKGTVDLRIVYDEGTRFPAYRIPYGDGLVSLVLSQQRPLLIRHMDEELGGLPVKGVIVGHQKISQSWLGVPILSGDKPTGVLALASYSHNVFDEEDLALLTTVAGQAAIALDNARHHAEVEEQSRRDSLTGIYNHGYFYRKLYEAAAAGQTGQPVSLIMLDIDYFKAYNDTYGHVKGDEVLRLAVQAILTHLAPDDFVGRWGGEEFGVALPGAGVEQAHRVAEGIRKTLAGLPLFDRDGRPIPKPTVSQGIATLPLHVSGADQLVDVADRMLYQAKNAGRDQIRVASGSLTQAPDRASGIAEAVVKPRYNGEQLLRGDLPHGTSAADPV